MSITDADMATAWGLVAPGADAFDRMCLKLGWHRLAERIAHTLATERATVISQYEAVAQWADQQAASRSHYAKVDPDYRNTIIPYEAVAERIRATGAALRATTDTAEATA